MDLSNNYFQVFNLPETYEIDLEHLKKHYRELQKQCHPDKFVGHTSQQGRLAEQYSVFINQAYTTLLSPLQRAQYILSLKDIDGNFDNVTHQDSAFLMEQMQLQESLSDIKQSPNATEQLDDITAVINDRYSELQQQFSKQITDQDYPEAKETVAKMYFFNKLQQQVEQLEEDLDLL